MKHFILLVPLVLLTACAGPRYTIQSVVQPGQTTSQSETSPACPKCGRLHAGAHAHSVPVIESKKQHTVAVRQVQAEMAQHERPEFVVKVKNEGTNAMDFSLSKIEVQRNGTPSKTYTVEELIAERDAQAAATATSAQSMSMVMGMNAQMNASFAQMSLNNATQPGVNTAYRAQQLNAAQSYVNQGMMQNNMARSYALDAALTSPQYGGLQVVLRPISIPPGQTGGGTVVTGYLPPPGPHTLKLKVDAAGETHEFEFHIQPKAK